MMQKLEEKAQARIRPLLMSDLDNIMTWVNNPEVVINFQNFDMHITREAEKAFLEKALANKDDRMYAVESESEEYLGNAGIHGISSKNKLGRLALIIGNRDYQGRGYGQSALKELLKYAFEENGLNKVWLIVLKENEKGIHIYNKTGFNVEGILREEYADREGKFHDMIRMSMLRKEYDTLKQEWEK